MENILFDIRKKYGQFKILNATNGGPFHKRHANDQYRSNFLEYKEAKIPYSRNHDSNACIIYGGPYAHDISSIFPNFDADENNPENYDFACTDESILATLEAGTKTFFRLGQTIEHQIKKHNTLPPKDFKKWVKICENIIRHYTEGWGEGFKLDMPYWEIWNEPDLDSDDSTNKRCWGGTKKQFFDFYEICAKHLKKCFPHLKIGGPALAFDLDFANEFLCEMQKREVPIDFFSWHIYCTEPKKVMDKAKYIRELLNKYGYINAESILNEWNYIKGWTDEYIYSLETIHGIKGAIFIMSVIIESQKNPIDMLMYYDTRLSAFNGVFDFYTYRPLKGYYPFKWYGEFYDYDYEVRSNDKIDDIYTLCGINKEGKIIAIIAYYSDDNNKENKTIKVNFNKDSEYEVYLLDKEHNGDLIQITKELVFDISIHSCLLIKEK